MKLLIVCQYYYPENVSITEIAEEFVKRGHEVTVVTGKPNYGFGKILPEYKDVRYEEINGVKIHRVNLYPRKKGILALIKNYLSFHHNSKKFLKHLKEDFDAVYSMCMSPLLACDGAGIFAKERHIPHIHHCLDLWPESAVIAGNVRKGSFIYKALYRNSRKIYSTCDKILISSPSFADYFRNELKLNIPLSLVPQPALLPKDKGKISSLPKDKFNLVYAGNIGNIQLVEKFVEATKLLEKDLPFRLTVVGSGAKEKAIKTLLDNKEISRYVYASPLVRSKEAVPFLRDADALLVSLINDGSSVSKTIPNKLVTSLYYGHPILASIGGDGEKVLKEAEGSFFTEPNLQDIANTYREMLMTEKEKILAMGESNRKYFHEHFESQKVLDLLEEEITSCKKDPSLAS